ncbi:MAG: hypothetical protein H6709_06615 [Kofleriaceae bacterium]|nr:hypothetical protein [Kofleriaceae bacterium]
MTTRRDPLGLAAGAAAAVAVAALIAPAVAEARPHTVTVKVVEVSGGVAYVEPGETEGLRAGATVKLGRKRYKIIAVTAAGAALDLAGGSTRVGAKGSIEVDPEALGPEVARMAAPKPLEAWVGQWPDATAPALAQTPTPVPLGSRAAPKGAIALTVRAGARAVATRDGDLWVSSWLGGRVSIEPWHERPLGADADADALVWAGDHVGDSAARPPLRVRELRLRYGAARDPYVSAGRLRWAAASVGQLDGARLAAPVGGGLTLAAFGGVVPDPVSGRPDPAATRFGVEVALDRPAAAWSPSLRLSAHGSTWEGTLDERRVAVEAAAGKGAVDVAAHVELDGFASDNPWGAKAIELGAAGLDVSWRRGGVHAGGRVDVRGTERSLRLAAALPIDWLCTTEALPAGGAAEPCASRMLRSQATAAAGWRGGKLAIDGGVTALHVPDSAVAVELSGFATARVELPARLRLQLGGDAGRASFVDFGGVTAALGGTALAGRLDLTARYRFGRVVYASAFAPLLAHRAGVDAALALGDLDVGLDAEVETGGDLEALAVLATLTWRPLR